MYFVIDCTDRKDSAHIRADNRARHLAWLESVRPAILSAGPKLADDGKSPLGSLLIIDFADRRAAEDFASADPYARAGLFSRVEISRYRQVLPVQRDGVD